MFSALLGGLCLFRCWPDSPAAAQSSICTYTPSIPLTVDYVFCFRESFPFLKATSDVSQFYEGVKVVDGHKQRHTIKGIEWVGESSFPPVPIVLITHDRLTVLLETIRSFHRFIRTPFEIVIHDEGSTFPALVAFLKMLEVNGVKVIRVPPRKQEELNSVYPLGHLVKRVAQTVERVLQSSKSDVYVVSDPDCALDGAPGHILDVYKHALKVMPSVKGVGAAIRIDDVRKDFLKASNEWEEPKQLEYFLYNDYPVRFTRRAVDTTFCMFRREFRFDRMQGSVRLEMPFGVRHLDFYFESLDKSPLDVVTYLTGNKIGISHASKYIK